MNSTNFQLTVGDKAKARCPDQGTCVQCGYISSQEVKRNVYSHRITHWYFSKNPNPRCARPACSWPVWTKGCHSWGSARAASIGKWWWLRCGDVDGDGVVIMIQIVQEDTCWPWDGRTYSEKRGSCDPPLPSPASCWQRQRKLTFARMIFSTVFSKTLALAHICLFFREECIVAYKGWRQKWDFLPSGLSRTSIVLSDWKISINTVLLFYWSDGHGPHKTVQVSMAPIRLHKTHLLHC